MEFVIRTIIFKSGNMSNEIQFSPYDVNNLCSLLKPFIPSGVSQRDVNRSLLSCVSHSLSREEFVSALIALKVILFSAHY